ncbi:twin-arginine translocase TatA/TatE family subunit [Deinococcus sp.]|uniref:Sec-independent protein translocase subunit TatA/TatB n=1 Tax=Deinococcus sp. TaxID=47478 RepID=UPI00286995CE|nr:twin-arginine translocase TatA/TatE family subunit [Deinococcus sp.]
MPNIGAPELLVILIVALVVFGPRKLPELGKSLGAGLREFRKSTQGLKEELEGSMKDTPTPPGPAAVQTIHVPLVQPAEVVPAQPVAASAVTPASVTPQAVIPQPVIPQVVTPQTLTPQPEPAERVS